MREIRGDEGNSAKSSRVSVCAVFDEPQSTDHTAHSRTRSWDTLSDPDGLSLITLCIPNSYRLPLYGIL